MSRAECEDTLSECQTSTWPKEFIIYLRPGVQKGFGPATACAEMAPEAVSQRQTGVTADTELVPDTHSAQESELSHPPYQSPFSALTQSRWGLEPHHLEQNVPFEENIP